MATPIRTKRTVLAADVRSTAVLPAAQVIGSAVPETNENIIPIYDTFNVINSETEVIELNRARSNLDAEGIRAGIPSYKLTGQTYLYGSGDATAGYAAQLPSATPATAMDFTTDVNMYGNYPEFATLQATGVLPPWTRFLFASGFTPVDVALGAAFGVAFQPVDISGVLDHWFFNGTVWLGGDEHRIWNARGNCVIAADVGQLPTLNFDMMGVYNTGGTAGGPVNPGEPSITDTGTNPTSLGLGIIPPRFCGPDSFLLYMEGADKTLQPKVLAASVDFGATPAFRKDANTAGCLFEIGIWEEYSPRLTVTIENEDFSEGSGGSDMLNDGSINWLDYNATFHKAFQDGTKFAFSLRYGSSTGRRIYLTNGGGGTDTGGRYQSADPFVLPVKTGGWDAAAPTNYLAQLASDPVYGDADGIRTLELEFILTGDSANWLQVVMI